MATKEKEDCVSRDLCREHMLWQERVDRIPSLLSWMNVTKGVMILMVLLMTVLFTITTSTRSELSTELNRRQDKMDRQMEEMNKQVRTIGDAVLDINSNVKVMTKTYELTSKQVASEVAELKERVEKGKSR